MTGKDIETRFAIGLGSNVGDRRRHLIDACRQLADRFGRPAVSPLYESDPVGGPDQGPFLNAVAVVRTEVEPLDLLDACHEIEQRHHRTRDVRWGPRTLDLDILATDGPPQVGDRLTIPHPRAIEREFVLRPLADVWPDASVGGGMTASEALARVSDQRVRLVADDWLPADT